MLIFVCFDIRPGGLNFSVFKRLCAARLTHAYACLTGNVVCSLIYASNTDFNSGMKLGLPWGPLWLS